MSEPNDIDERRPDTIAADGRLIPAEQPQAPTLGEATLGEAALDEINRLNRHIDKLIRAAAEQEQQRDEWQARAEALADAYSDLEQQRDELLAALKLALPEIGVIRPSEGRTTDLQEQVRESVRAAIAAAEGRAQ